MTGSENGDSYQAWLAVKDNAFIPGQFLWTGLIISAKPDVFLTGVTVPDWLT